MIRSGAILLGGLLGLTAAASGCAQLAGLTDDYHLASAGSAAEAGSANGGTLGAGGHGGNGGHADETDDAGAAGDIGGEAGTNANGGQATTGGRGATGGHAGVVGTGGSNGGAGSSHGGTSSGGTSSGGTGNGGTGNGGSNTSAGSGGLGAVGGSAGSGPGPTRIGFSMFHDSAFGNDNASSHLPDASFQKPAGTAAGDLILVFFGSDHSLGNLGGSALKAVGWELIDQHSDIGTDGQGTYLLYRIATGNEPDPIVFKDINPPDSGNGVQGLLSVYRGVNGTSPVNAYESHVMATGTDGLNFVNSTPEITTTAPNCLLITGLSPDTTVDRPVIDVWPAGFTENQVSVVNAPNPYPLGWANIYSAERHLPNAGTVPMSAFNWHVTDKTNGGTFFGYVTFVLALAPAN